jgi:hypothetical protein
MENVLASELLRGVNDRIFQSAVDRGGEGGNFACECGDESCNRRMEITLVEYAASRDERILSPGHVFTEPASADEEASPLSDRPDSRERADWADTGWPLRWASRGRAAAHRDT